MKLFRRASPVIGIIASGFFQLAACGAEPPTLVPPPREVRWSAAAPIILAPDTVAIILSRQATPPEEQGARLLQEAVAKRFGQHWPVLREGSEKAGHKVLVLLGQRTTCRRIDELCRAHGIELSTTSPGPDGYIIQALQYGDRWLLLVGGCNDRGVEYGQDTLFQMLRPNGKDVTLVPGSIRDTPVIPWRGRPQTQVSYYLRPGELDLYVRSRINFIDLRGGIYAFDPGEKLNHTEIATAVKEAHLRGLIVYGTVNCGVPAGEREKVLGTFRELLDLGADGLWLSFDDKGPGGDPVALVNEALELGRQRQISGHLIAITPPKGSYPKISTDFNQKIMAIPGMEEAVWFWTAVPSSEALAEARSIGLKAKPGWWHNWPRRYTPQAYTGVPPMALGWSSPDYDVLAAGGDCLAAVMPWGGNEFGQEYIVPVIGWWGWNPQAHDWNALRHRIGATVFGESEAVTAMKFDDQLQKLFARFHYSSKTGEDLPLCPPRLRNPADREAAKQLTADLTAALDQLFANAPKDTLLTEPEVRSKYLNPMRKELDTHRAAVGLAFPEDWWPEHQRKVLEAVYAGDVGAADKFAAAGRARVLGELGPIGKALPTYPHMKAYTEWWRKQAALDAKGWNSVIQARRKALDERVREYSRQSVNAGTMLAGLRSPPLEWGIGRWQVNNRLLATVLPSPNEQFWGSWLAGVHEEHGIQAAVFAANRKTPGDVGEYAELSASVPVSGRRERLGLMIFVSSANKDLFSNTMIKYRWAGYRFVELLWQDKVLWEADLGQVPEGGDWFLVRLPRIPENVKELALRLRVEDRKLSMNNYTISYVGPLRLLELPE